MMALRFEETLQQQESWIAQEQHVQKDLSSLRSWLALLEITTTHANKTYIAVAQQETNTLTVEANFSAALSSLVSVNNSVNETFERALRQLPFCYKLWVWYLKTRHEQLNVVERLLRRCFVPVGTIQSFVSSAQRAILSKYESATEILPKMPRIWLNFIDACALFGAGTRLRSAIKGAMLALPSTQRRKVWMHVFSHVLQKTESRENQTGYRIPLITYQAIWARLVNAAPTTFIVEGYLRFLVRHKRIDHLLSCLDALTAPTSTAEIRSLGRQLLGGSTIIWVEVVDLLTGSQEEEAEGGFLSFEKRQVIFSHLLSFLKQQFGGGASASSESLSADIVDSMELAMSIHLCAEGQIDDAIGTLKGIINSTHSAHHFQRTFQVLLQILCSAAELSTGDQATKLTEDAERLVQEYPMLKIAATLRADPSDPVSWRSKIDLLRERLELAMSVGDGGEADRTVQQLEDTYEQAILRLTRFNARSFSSVDILDPTAAASVESADIQGGEVSTVACEILEEYSMFLFGLGKDEKAMGVLSNGAFRTRFDHINHNLELFQRLGDHLVSQRKFSQLASVLAKLSLVDPSTNVAVQSGASSSSGFVATRPHHSGNIFSDANSRSKRVVGGVFAAAIKKGAASSMENSHAGQLQYSPAFWEHALKFAFICNDHFNSGDGSRMDQKIWERVKQSGMCSVAVALVYVTLLKDRDLRQRHVTTAVDAKEVVVLSLGTLLEIKEILSDTFSAAKDPRAKCIIATKTIGLFLQCRATITANVGGPASTSYGQQGELSELGFSSEPPSREALMRSGIIKTAADSSATTSHSVVMFRESLRDLVSKALRSTIGMRERANVGSKRNRESEDVEKDLEGDNVENPLKAFNPATRGFISPNDEAASTFSVTIKDLLLQYLNFETAVSSDNGETPSKKIAVGVSSKASCPILDSLKSAWEAASATPKFVALDREGELRTIAMVVGNSFHQYPLSLSDLLVVLHRYLDLVLEIRGVDALRLTAALFISTSNNKHEVALCATVLARAEEKVGSFENAARVLNQCWATVSQPPFSADKSIAKTLSGTSLYTEEFIKHFNDFKGRHPSLLSTQK